MVFYYFQKELSFELDSFANIQNRLIFSTIFQIFGADPDTLSPDNTQK